MGKKYGILYALSNKLWQTNLKCGLTTQKLQKRISNLQTSLYHDCEIISYTEPLIDCKIYEFLLKKTLKDYRVRDDREFFNIDHYEIKKIYETFNYINSILNTTEKLNIYIKNNHSEYFSKKRNKKNISDSTDSSVIKKKTKIFIDTSNL